jgi:hypothetical protein
MPLKNPVDIAYELIEAADALGTPLVFDARGNRVSGPEPEHAEYTRVRDGGLEVGVVSWTDPHTPSLEWVAVARLVKGEDTEAARRALLLDTRYFAVCDECHKHNVRGHMTGAICQGCARRNHGVVF